LWTTWGWFLLSFIFSEIFLMRSFLA
jgi:hypothetical protein